MYSVCYVSRHKVIRRAVQDGRRRDDYATPGMCEDGRRGRGERSSTTIVQIFSFFLTLFPYRCITSQEFVYDGVCPARKDWK